MNRNQPTLATAAQPLAEILTGLPLVTRDHMGSGGQRKARVESAVLGGEAQERGGAALPAEEDRQLCPDPAPEIQLRSVRERCEIARHSREVRSARRHARTRCGIATRFWGPKCSRACGWLSAKDGEAA